MDVVAEGVETEQHLAYLKEMKCTYGQGYLFSQPAHAQAAHALLQVEHAQAGHLYPQVEQREDGALLSSTLIM